MLDRNGYAESIVQPNGEVCFLCGRSSGKLDRHEIWGGALRSKSKRLGLWILLCHYPCHMEKAHGDRGVMTMLRQKGQEAAMAAYGWTIDEFIKQIGRNYL